MCLGFYRVNYDNENWMALIKQLHVDHEQIHVINRAQLINDAFALAKAGYLDYSVPLHLTEYLTNENNAMPFHSALNEFSYLLRCMRRDRRGYEKLKVNKWQLNFT